MTVKNSDSYKTLETLRQASGTVKGEDRQKSRTIPIPVDEIFEDIPLSNASYLLVQMPGEDPTKVPIGKQEIFVGRDEECRISIPISNVSRRHARIFCQGEEHIVEDLESTNGTYVNGVKVTRCILRNNDHIRIGDTRIQYIQQKIRE
jgi:hypothetical protein